MKTIMSFIPTFDPALKTVDFSGFSGFELDRLYAIINITRNKIIYAVAQTGLGQSSFASNVITLQFDTSTHSSSDILMIIYDNQNEIQKTQDVDLSSIANEIKQLNENMTLFINFLMANQQQLDAFKRPQVVSAGGTLTTVTTVSNVSSINGYGGIAGRTPYDSSNMGANYLYDNIIVS